MDMEKHPGEDIRIIIDATGLQSCQGIAADISAATAAAIRNAFPDSCPEIHSGRRTCRKVHLMLSSVKHADTPVLLVSLSGKLPAMLPEKHPGIIAAAVVTDMDFVSAPSGYSWIRRHLMNLAFHMLRRKADLYISADSFVKQDIHRYYFIPKDRIGVADDPAALALFLRSAAGGTLSSAVDKAK